MDDEVDISLLGEPHAADAARGFFMCNRAGLVNIYITKNKYWTKYLFNKFIHFKNVIHKPFCQEIKNIL